MLQSLINRIMQTANKSYTTFAELAIAAVEGKKVTDAQVRDACRDNCVPLEEFASHVKVLARRKEAWDSLQGRDWAAERQAVIETRKRISADQKRVSDELAILRSESGRLAEEERRLFGIEQAILKEEKDARDHADKVLRQTGAPDDWRNIGEPQPIIRRRPQPGERINIGV